MMEIIEIIKKFREMVAIVLKCVGFALAVAVFVCMVLETMQIPDAAEK